MQRNECISSEGKIAHSTHCSCTATKIGSLWFFKLLANSTGVSTNIVTAWCFYIRAFIGRRTASSEALCRTERKTFFSETYEVYVFRTSCTNGMLIV